ncbi:MAG: hypothetical protein ACTS1Z_00430 [Parasphingopyxis sp.]|uniref:hypothetical protein n=1 Tax=Parasphingopyxis sp. TaxID=1920299 RepID=UPI003F9F7AFD
MRETVRPVPEPLAAEPDELEAKKSYPKAATLVVCLLLAAALFGAQGSDTGVTNSAQSIGFVIGWVLGGVALWSLAWGITIRHAPKAWKWRSLAIVVAAGLFTGLVRLA